MSSQEHIIVKPACDYLDSVFNVLKNRGKEPELSITSLPALNDKVWGLSKKEMTCIAAKTSMGKTAFSLQIIHDMLMQDKSVLYITLEMSYEDLIERLFSHHSEINNQELRRGKFDWHTDKWGYFGDWLRTRNLVINDGIGRSIKVLDSFVSNIESVPDVIVIDYIQALKGASDVGKAFIDEFLRKFREMCMVRNFAGVVISQINRSSGDSKDKRPQLHQLQGSSFLEQHSDQVWLLDWECKHNSSASEDSFYVNVGKNRNGKTGFIRLRYNPGVYGFEDW